MRWLMALVVLCLAAAAAGCKGPAVVSGTLNHVGRVKLGGAFGTPIAATLTPDGHALAVAGAHGPVQVWRLPISGDGSPTTFETTDELVTTRFVTPELILIGMKSSRVILWDWVHNRTVVDRVFAEGRSVTMVAASDTGRYLASAGVVFDVDQRREIGSSNFLPTETGLQFAAGSKVLLSAGFHGGQMVLRDLPSGQTRRRLAPGPITGAALSPAGDWVVTGVRGSSVHVWRSTDERPTRSWSTSGEVRSVQITGDIVVVISEGAVEARQLSTGASRFRAPIRDLSAWATQDAFVATGTVDGAVNLWNVAEGRPLASSRPFPSLVRALGMSPASRLLVAADVEGNVEILRWDN